MSEKIDPKAPLSKMAKLIIETFPREKKQKYKGKAKLLTRNNSITNKTPNHDKA